MIVGFHVVLAAAFSIGSFPYVCIVAWLVFLPGLLWDALARRVPALGAAGSAAPVAAGHLHAVLPRPLGAVSTALRLHQHWGPCADVQPFDFWATLHGTTAGGGAVDPLRGGAPLQGHPSRAADLFPNHRWRIYFYALIQRAIDRPPTPALEALTTRVADTLCRRWNARHDGGERLVSLRIAFVAEYFDPASYRAPTEVYAVERRCDEARESVSRRCPGGPTLVGRAASYEATWPASARSVAEGLTADRIQGGSPREVRIYAPGSAGHRYPGLLRVMVGAEGGNS